MQSDAIEVSAYAQPEYAVVKKRRCVMYSKKNLPLFVFEVGGVLDPCAPGFNPLVYLGEIIPEEVVLHFNAQEIGTYPFSEFRAFVEKHQPYFDAVYALMASADPDNEISVRHLQAMKLESMLTDDVVTELKKSKWNLPASVATFEVYPKGSRARSSRVDRHAITYL